MKSLPRYKSHKIVEAAKIATIGVGRDGNHRLFRSLADGAVTPGIIVTAQYMEKHNPQKGGYYVRYPDGYESWSPAEAFEDGYTLVDEQPLKPGIGLGRGGAGRDAKFYREEGHLKTADQLNPTPIQHPSVGRTVQYHAGPVDTYHEWNAAIIVYVHPQGWINLKAWDHDGQERDCSGVVFGEGAGRWRWPPRV